MSLTGLDRDHELRQQDKVKIRCSAGCSFPNASFVFQYVVSSCQTLIVFSPLQFTHERFTTRLNILRTFELLTNSTVLVL